MRDEFNLIGRRFGRLLVSERVAAPSFANPSVRTNRWWRCLCDCGNQILAPSARLRGGTTHSCGCLRRSHGDWKSREYAIWAGMIQRCENPKDKNYASYGGRGIAVCPEWRQSYARFLADVGPRPGTDYSIDRINNNGDYDPTNVRWATRSEQQRNKRDKYRDTLTIASA